MVMGGCATFSSAALSDTKNSSSSNSSNNSNDGVYRRVRAAMRSIGIHTQSDEEHQALNEKQQLLPPRQNKT